MTVKHNDTDKFYICIKLKLSPKIFVKCFLGKVLLKLKHLYNESGWFVNVEKIIKTYKNYINFFVFFIHFSINLLNINYRTHININFINLR